MDRRISHAVRICVVCCAVILVPCASPAAAQQRPGLMGDLADDLNVVEAKIVGLANAMPPAACDWRPGPSVRSTAEVLIHVAGDNYFMPALIGVPAPRPRVSTARTTKRSRRSKRATYRASKSSPR